MSLSVDQILRKAKRHAKKGEIDRAAEMYRSVLEVYPKNRRAIEGLKRFQQPKEVTAVKNGGPSQEQINKVIALYKQGRFQETLVQGEALAKQFPNVPFFADLIGSVNVHLGRLEKAVASYTKALQINPDFAEAHNNLGNALNILGRSEEAISSFTKALQIKPDYAAVHNNLGNALTNLGKPEEAVASYNNALQINPDFAEAHNNLGNALTSIGKPEEAVASYTKVLQIKPDCAEAHWNLSNAKEYQDGDPQIHQMLQLVEQHNLSDEDRMHLNFALGKAYDDIGDHDKAFSCLLVGNSLCKKQLKYEISLDRALFAKIKSTFSEDVPALNAVKVPEGATGQKPIFILGMPRSGTTLVEQILASHSQVYGAGEMRVLGQSVNTIEWNSTQLSSAKLESIRKSYLSGLQKIGASEPYITDKMPHNFFWIGFIFAMTPEAKIVHVKRDARATCWSNFKYHFSSKGIGFAYNLQDVAEYYKMYIDLMAFWYEKFPGQIYDLNYDALTERQESETRNLLEYVGLEWEDQCLEFHETKRAIQTSSAAQVRQKMYRGSSKNWRNYEKHLEPLIERLRGF